MQEIIKVLLAGDWTHLLYIVGLVVVLGLAYWLIRLVKQKALTIENDRIREIVLDLVRAAEQRLGPKAGAKKLRWVKELAEGMGLKITDKDIEAAVWLLNRFDLGSTGPPVE